MLRELESQLDHIKAKREILAEVYPSADGSTLLSFYTRIMPKVVDAERCSVFIHDAEKDKVWLKIGTDVTQQAFEVPKRGSVVGDVIASGMPAVVSGLDAKAGAHNAIDEITGFVTRNVLCVPIRSPVRNEVTGAFQLLNKLNDREFTREDISLAMEVARHLQNEVDGIFLGQEAVGLSERLFSVSRKTRTFTIVSGVVVLLMSFLALLGSGILVRFLG